MRILLVSSRYPWPPWRGNQVRSVQWLAALAEHEVTLACPLTAGAGTGALATVEVVALPSGLARRANGVLRAALSGRPLQEGLYDAPAARRAVAAAMRAFEPEVVVVQMVRCAWALEAARAAAPSVPVVFDAIDAMGLHFERAVRGGAAWSAPLFRSEARRCRRREAALAAAAALTTAVSARDLAALSVARDRGRVLPVSGRVMRRCDPAGADPVVLLSGNLGYRPTVRAALWFAREVWPELRRRVPGARWVMAGARPPAVVRRLARLPGVEVAADVADLSAYLARARVALAPMSIGSGVPLKVLEAMAAGVPVVAHPWAADGLAREAGEAVVVADGVEAWTGSLARLLGDPAAAAELGERGHEAWLRHYHPDVVTDQIRTVLTEATEKR